MIIEELIVIKEYLLENLYKGFIILSNTPFTSFILFVSKLNRSLYYDINLIITLGTYGNEYKFEYNNTNRLSRRILKI